MLPEVSTGLFDLSADQISIQSAARKFAQQELIAIADEIESTSLPINVGWRQKYARSGFLGVNIGERWGGIGLSNLEALLIVKEFALVSQAVAWPVFESVVGPIKIIEKFAGEDLKARLLPAVCRGEIVIAAAMSEPDAGSALTDLRTTAVKTQNGYVLNGQKRWCSGAGHAEGYLVFCRMGDGRGRDNIAAIYVDRDHPGLSFGQQESLMGFRGIGSADIFFDNAEVPESHVVVSPGSIGRLMSVFNLERCGNATMCLANAEAAFQISLAYVQERKQFGKPIVDFQAVQMRLADMYMRLRAAELLIYRAVGSSDALPTAEASSLAKCYANEIAREVTSNAMQIMGGYGYARAYGVERRHRDAWGWGVAGGVIDIQKINLASHLVGRRFSQR
ncbi:MAG: acyl-CoA/acyl-ACP dehydrogenase [Sphingomonadales bacterium]|nr:acyl-CoA/acyl-ACP dehydrogenase [Sphingomonadales bacterium]